MAHQGITTSVKALIALALLMRETMSVSELLRQMQEWLAFQSHETLQGEFDWVWIPDSITRIHKKSYQSVHPCLRLVDSAYGASRIWIRSTTNNGEYPYFYPHAAHHHDSTACQLNKDASVEAMMTRLVPNNRITDNSICKDESLTWLHGFMNCLRQLEELNNER